MHYSCSMNSEKSAGLKKKKKKKGQKHIREKMQTQMWTNQTDTKYGLFVSMALMEFMS